MTFAAALWGFAGIAFLITIIPATDTALVLRALTAQGSRAALACVFGITAGLLIWGVAAATGLAVLMVAIPGVFDFITFSGGLYLLYLGIKFLLNLKNWNKATILETPSHEVIYPNDDGDPRSLSTPCISGQAQQSSTWQSFLSGFIANILNPKIAVFYLATVPPFMVDSVPPLLMGTGLALVHGGINVLWFAVIISLARFAMKWLLHPRATLIIDGITGTVLTMFGLIIVFEALHKLL